MVSAASVSATRVRSPTSISASPGVSAKAALANNDGYSFFSALGDLVKTGPTLTNVNDFRALLIEAESTPQR